MKNGPTTVFGFIDGQPYIVRDAHTCLPNPPIQVTVDPAVDVVAFNRQFSFDLTGITRFLVSVFSLGKAKTQLEMKRVKSASVQMGGLAHHTIQTGEMLDYLLSSPGPKPAYRADLLDKNHLTIVAALLAGQFTYRFTSEGVPRWILSSARQPECSRWTPR